MEIRLLLDIRLAKQLITDCTRSTFIAAVIEVV